MDLESIVHVLLQFEKLRFMDVSLCLVYKCCRSVVGGAKKHNKMEQEQSKVEHIEDW